MNLILASDDNYAPFMGILLHSILQSNQKDKGNEYTGKIVVYILDREISADNKEKLALTVQDYNCNLSYVPTERIDHFLEKQITQEVSSLAKYYRLFLSTVLPDSVKKVIYLDCDGLVFLSLKSLWETNIEEYEVAGVLDIISPSAKEEIGMDQNEDYINSGMLLINVEKWRKNNMEQQMMEYIISSKGQNFKFNDQRVVNKVCKKKKILEPKYNVLTPFFVMKVKQLKRFHHIRNFYTQAQLDEAVRNPVFCHLTPYLTDRPWVEGNFHPLKQKYLFVQKETPWQGITAKNNPKQLNPRLKTLFRLLPVPLFILLIQLIGKFK